MTIQELAEQYDAQGTEDTQAFKALLAWENTEENLYANENIKFQTLNKFILFEDDSLICEPNGNTQIWRDCWDALTEKPEDGFCLEYTEIYYHVFPE